MNENCHKISLRLHILCRFEKSRRSVSIEWMERHVKKLSPFKIPLSDEKKQYKYINETSKKKRKRLVHQEKTIHSSKMSYLAICFGELPEVD